ncbi:hypothetical protein [Paraburkholderia sp.]|uniref:hypothetical protein n=1 Tax=Paraburkholderia sp. TaxID=1926495 RepID=UPI003D6E23CD
MNRLLIAASRQSIRASFAALAAFVAVAGTGVAYAQDASDPSQQTQPMQQTQPVAATPAASNDVGGSYAGSASSGAAGLTRADVRQQLVHSERDGQLKQLDDTLYKGGQ